MKSIIIVDSYHHNNTLKIANAFAKVLNCEVISPQQAETQDLQKYELIGFGSGIDSGRHYKTLLDLAAQLPAVKDKPAFIFSTSAIQGYAKVEKDHSSLREKLRSKGYIIAGEFSCKGYNTNSFLQFTGGLNNGKPDEKDLRDAEEFATALLSSYPMVTTQVKYGI